MDNIIRELIRLGETSRIERLPLKQLAIFPINKEYKDGDSNISTVTLIFKNK